MYSLTIMQGPLGDRSCAVEGRKFKTRKELKTYLNMILPVPLYRGEFSDLLAFKRLERSTHLMILNGSTRKRFYVEVIFNMSGFSRRGVVSLRDGSSMLKQTPNTALIGPFRTRRGAEYMARNPYCACVADAEREAARK